MFYFYCNLYNTRATAVLSWTTFCPVFTDFSASFLTTSWKMPKKHPKFFLVLLMSRSKLSLSKKLANSMILANDLCQPSVRYSFKVHIFMPNPTPSEMISWFVGGRLKLFETKFDLSFRFVVRISNNLMWLYSYNWIEGNLQYN